MDFFKKHADAVFVIATIIGAMVWMNTQFKDVRKDINDLRTDMAVMKTVLIMQKIMPSELASKGEVK